MRPKAFIAVLCIFFAGCAHQSAPAPVEPAAPAAPPAVHPPEPVIPSPPPPPAAPAEEEPSVPLEGKNLRQAISAWISEHEGADFELVARTANRLMRRHGYPVTVDASPVLKPGQDTLRLKAGGRIFLLQAGRELELGPDSCGERYLHLPARISTGDQADLISGGKAYPFSLKPFHRETFRIYRGKRLVAELPAPEPSEPIGVSGNGQALFLRFPLEEQLTLGWWQRVARQQPSLLDEDPYLVLRVSRKRLYFDENIEHLPAQEMEVDHETEPGQYRWRFLPSGFLLELFSTCSH